MTRTVCDYCGKEVKEPFHDYRGDLDGDHLAVSSVWTITEISMEYIVQNEEKK